MKQRALFVKGEQKTVSAKPGDNTPRYSAALIGSHLILVAYIIIRFCVYYFFPITSENEWFIRDALMSVPRLGAFATLLYLNKIWKIANFELPLAEFQKVAFLGFVPLVLWVFFFSGGQGDRFAFVMMFGGCLTSLIVGLFEEYAFRGPLLSALRRYLSLFPTVTLSNVIFVIFHAQAQPFRFWFIIFLMGVIFSNLRFRGLSLGWLALIHALIDSFYFFFPVNAPDPLSFHGLVLQVGLLAYAVVTYPRAKVVC